MSGFIVGISNDLAPDVLHAIHAYLTENAPAYVGWESCVNAAGNNLPSAALERFDAIIVGGAVISASSIPKSPRCMLLSRWGVGYDLIDLAAITAADIALTITSTAVRYPTAEAALAYVFALAKNTQENDAVTRAGKWKTGLSRRAVDIRGTTLGSLGLGNIGRALFEIARSVGFGRFIAYDHHADASESQAIGVELVSLAKLCAESDFLTINVPLNDATRGMIGRDQLALMKPGAFLINTARGGIVDEVVLRECLEGGGIAGAGIDVFSEEPVTAAHPLLTSKRTLLSPHALAQTAALALGAGREAAQNVLSIARGDVPASIVNRSILKNPPFLARLEDRRARSAAG